MSTLDDADPERCADADAHFAYTAINDLGLCGCGRHDAIVAEVLGALRCCPLYEHTWTPDSGLGWMGAELLLHVMDNAELIDHGTSIRGSWITPKGERLLSVLADKDAARYLDDAPGFSCSNCPTRAASGLSGE